MPPTTSSPKRPSVNLQVCIDELRLIQSLSEKNKKDPRLGELVKNAKEDILDVLSKIHSGDDTGKSTTGGN